ncbi:KTSC domain-containing protein [Rhizobium sp. CG5]|uniref:KTSC domain-containing protein n=1 Tax=Rhizobium sp. CG5 TaxID=2726076 RepID=UPI002034901D|nr:KTSC domain-containing protein [Rhizobium sp. CG5]MCM2476548.1 KTSC domain-containing protein [Rhizobium sp. CG5]
MSKVHLTSREIAAVEYDVGSGRLKVETRKGGLYEITDVPAHVYATLVASQSPGTFYHLHIRKGDYKITRLR